MDLGLKGKTAIVTGASQGIGEAIARVLANEGVDVFLVARNGENLQSIAADIARKTGCRTGVLAADLTDPKAPAAAVEAAVKTFGKLDILVNNAGATKRGNFFELTDDDWISGFGLKFFSTMRMTRSAWPHLRASKGAIVNIIGIGSRAGAADYTIGGSVNSAIANFTKATGDIGRKEGVRVNAINPGHIATSRLERRITTAMQNNGLNRDEAMKRLISEYGINRFGQPEEIGRLVAILCSAQVEFIHGTIIDMDGGQVLAL